MKMIRRLAGLAGVVVLGVATVALLMAPARSAPPAPDRPLKVLWVGDSFVAGAGSSTGRGYPTLVCARLKWDCTIDGQGGTGFVANGHNNSLDFVPFLGRLDQDAAQVTPDLVVVDGGRNDEREPPAKVVSAAAEYTAALRVTYPQARFVFVLPTFLRPQTDDEVRIGRVLTSLAGQQSGEVVDPGRLRWITSEQQARPLLAKDRVHPNDAGHAYLARQLMEAFADLGLV